MAFPSWNARTTPGGRVSTTKPPKRKAARAPGCRAHFVVHRDQGMEILFQTRSGHHSSTGWRPNKPKMGEKKAGRKSVPLAKRG